MKKLLRGALDIKSGKKEHLEFGNLNIKRDFGWSEKYVEAMWLMLQQSVPDDYVICSGKSVMLRDIVYYVFERLEIDKTKISVNDSLFRPTEIEDIYGSNEKAQRELHWTYDMDYKQLIDVLLQEEQLNYGKQDK
jgi:GDPmannose 4,6-dehydratase